MLIKNIKNGMWIHKVFDTRADTRTDGDIFRVANKENRIFKKKNARFAIYPLELYIVIKKTLDLSAIR